MFELHDRITATVEESYTYLKDFRLLSMEDIDFSRLNEINIEGELEYINTIKENIGKYTSNPLTLNGFSNYSRYKINWRIFNEETDEWEDFSFSVNIPLLYEGLYWYIAGSKYFLLYNLARNNIVHSKEKIIFKNYEDLFILNLDGIAGFNMQGKKVNIIPVLTYHLMKNGMSFNILLDTIFKNNYEITDKKDQRLKVKKHILFQDFALILPKYPNKYQKPFVKALDRIKRYSMEDFVEKEKLEKRIKLFYSSGTSRKAAIILEDTMNILNKYSFETIIKEINRNIDGDFNYTNLSVTPEFSEIIVNEIYKELKRARKIYLSSNLKNYQRLKRAFNKNLLENIVVNGLFSSSKLLQFVDGVNYFDQSLKVSLSKASGRSVNSKSREITEEYKNLLSLFQTGSGKNTGLSTMIAPV